MTCRYSPTARKVLTPDGDEDPAAVALRRQLVSIVVSSDAVFELVDDKRKDKEGNEFEALPQKVIATRLRLPRGKGPEAVSCLPPSMSKGPC